MCIRDSFSLFLFWAHRFDNCFPPHPDPVLPSTFCDMFAGHTIRSGKVRIPTSNGLLHDPNYVYGHLDQDIMKKRWTALGEVSPYIHHLKAASSNRCVCYASILLRTIGSFGLKPSPTVSCYGSYFGSCVDLFRCAWSPCDMVGWCCAYFIATSPPLPNSRLRA